MEPVLRHRGRGVSTDDVESVRKLIWENPTASRRALSFKVCELWNWKQENGQPRDMVCRGLLLALHRVNLIQLPEAQWRPKRPPRRRVPQVIAAELDESPLECGLRELGPVELRQVRRTANESLVEELIERHHYLGYTRPVGEHLKYLVSAQGRPIGCFCWSSAPRHLGPRDRLIGWTANERRKNIRFVAYQSRFLILPWVHVPHLASHLLGRMSRQVSRDWQALYAHPIFLAETFVDPTKYKGTSYRASNWLNLGVTTGRGKADHTGKPNRPLKDIFVYPLVRGFQERLRAGA